MHDHGASSPLSIDDFAAELQRLRTEADKPSYAELAARIARRREAAGESPARARVARSTVYDVFRPGRRRLDVALVRDVLVAMGLHDDVVYHWTAVARTAVPGHAAATASTTVAVAPEPVAHPSAWRTLTDSKNAKRLAFDRREQWCTTSQWDRHESESVRRPA